MDRIAITAGTLRRLYAPRRVAGHQRAFDGTDEDDDNDDTQHTSRITAVDKQSLTATLQKVEQSAKDTRKATEDKLQALQAELNKANKRPTLDELELLRSSLRQAEKELLDTKQVSHQHKSEAQKANQALQKCQGDVQKANQVSNYHKGEAQKASQALVKFQGDLKTAEQVSNQHKGEAQYAKAETAKLQTKCEEDVSVLRTRLSKAYESAMVDFRTRTVYEHHRELSESYEAELEELREHFTDLLERRYTAEEFDKAIANRYTAAQLREAITNAVKARETVLAKHHKHQMREAVDLAVETRELDIASSYAEMLHVVEQSAQAEKNKTLEEHNRIVTGLKDKHVEVVQVLKTEQDSYVIGLKDKHADAVQVLKTKHENNADGLKREHADAVQVLKTKHENNADGLKREHAEALQALKTEHNGTLKSLKTEHENNADRLKREHAEALQALKTEHAEKVDRLTSDHTGDVRELDSKLLAQRAESHAAAAYRLAKLSATLEARHLRNVTLHALRFDEELTKTSYQTTRMHNILCSRHARQLATLADRHDANLAQELYVQRMNQLDVHSQEVDQRLRVQTEMHDARLEQELYVQRMNQLDVHSQEVDQKLRVQKNVHDAHLKQELYVQRMNQLDVHSQEIHQQLRVQKKVHDAHLKQELHVQRMNATDAYRQQNDHLCRYIRHQRKEQNRVHYASLFESTAQHNANFKLQREIDAEKLESRERFHLWRRRFENEQYDSALEEAWKILGIRRPSNVSRFDEIVMLPRKAKLRMSRLYREPIETIFRVFCLRLGQWPSFDLSGKRHHRAMREFLKQCVFVLIEAVVKQI